MNAPSEAGPPGYLWPRWLFLRALGLIFLSAFYSFAFQIHGLIGERGILPAGEYLALVHRELPGVRQFWYAPTLLWFNAGDTALTLVVAAGVVCSLLLVANIAPKLTVALCTLLFLSCIAALQDFSSYQSDGMLLEAGFLSIFFAPRGLRPKLGATSPPSSFSLFMLRWEWFRIYFESGIVKLASGDPHWRDLTAMDEYYQNGPLPTWIGWYVQHLPHWYHAGTVIFTLLVELLIVWAVFLPRPFRLTCAAIVTALQVGIIATANYAFLNYLVLALGVLLLDDRFLARWLPVPADASATPSARHPITQWAERGVLGYLFCATIVAFFVQSAFSSWTRPFRRAGPVSHRERLRTLRRHDRGPVRDRVPGKPRRSAVGRVSVSVQAAGPDASTQASTPRISRASSGTCGSRRSARGSSRRGSCRRSSVSSREARPCCDSSDATRSRASGRRSFERCCTSTGSPTSPRSGRRARGGDGPSSGRLPAWWAP